MNCTWRNSPIVETTESQRYRYRKTGMIFCLDKGCGYAHRTANLKPRQKKPKPLTVCFMCGEPAPVTANSKATGRAYCSRECSNAYRAKISSETMVKTNRKYASARMKRNNPMARPEIREKMSATLKTIGHAPKVRGGNGRPPTAAEIRLNEMLGQFGFINQLILTTRAGSPYPNHYKIDCGHAALKIAIETDGQSHLAIKRREQDAKKDAFLRGNGWTVLRLTNAQVMSSDLPTILRSMGFTLTLLME